MKVSKVTMLLLPFVFGDMIYQNRLGNNRLTVSMQSSAPQQKPSHALNVISQLARNNALSNGRARNAFRKFVSSYRHGTVTADNIKAIQGKQRFGHFRRRFRKGKQILVDHLLANQSLFNFDYNFAKSKKIAYNLYNVIILKSLIIMKIYKKS